MENDEKDKRLEGERKCHYCVLYAKVLKQWEVTQAIQRAFPEGRGTVFYPCAELWMNGYEQTVFRPLFPGYVFIRSEMEPSELHDIIRRCRSEVLSFIKELHVSERKAIGELMAEESDEEYDLFDLSDDEAEFMDFMLNFRYEDREEKTRQGDEARSKDPQSQGEDRAAQKKEPHKKGEERAAQKRRPRKIPEAGVLQMSYGYREGKRYVVMEGPLKGYEDHIADVNTRDRKAYLDIKINGRTARAGLELRGKKYWFPDDKQASDILQDGTEINLTEIAKLMMCGKEKPKKNNWTKRKG